MSETGLGRPGPGDYHTYFTHYVELVPEHEVVPVLEHQLGEVERLLHGVDDAKAAFRYAPGKWSVREVVGHLSDSERLFGYRALAFARGERAPLPGFAEDEYVRQGGFDRIPLAELVGEFRTGRLANLDLLRHLTAEAWARGGEANRKPQTVRAIAYIIAGHVRHHLQVLRERYGVAGG